MPGFLAEVLYREDNGAYRLAIKTAKSWGMPPTKVIRPDAPDGWTEKDSLLAMAMTVLESETCNQCNTPVWIGYSTDNTLQFKLESTVCYGCAELEKDRKAQEKKKDRVATPGESKYVVPYTVFDSGSMPSRKDLFKKKSKGK